MRIEQAFCSWLIGCALRLGVAPVHAAEPPLSVTYGPAASSAEGDPDFREIIFLSVPEALTERLYLRVFDPDTGGDHDLIYGEAEDTEVRYSLFGGEGAYTGVPPRMPDAGDEAASAEDVVADAKAEPVNAGELLAERLYGTNASLDDRWQTLASFLPSAGELVDGRRVFRLLVEGLEGNDANLYSATLSLRDRRNLRPDGLEVFAYAPTLRAPDPRSITDVPRDAERLVVRNFDLAGGDIALTSTFPSVPLPASGQNQWQGGGIALLDEERGAEVALVFGGSEIPNDVTLFVTDQEARPLALRLPAKSWRSNTRPEPAANIMPLANCYSVAFDAAPTSDADGDQLRYSWEFGDGSSASGPAPVHTYAGRQVSRDPARGRQLGSGRQWRAARLRRVPETPADGRGRPGPAGRGG